LPAVEMPPSQNQESIAYILRKEGYVGEVSVRGKVSEEIKLN